MQLSSFSLINFLLLSKFCLPTETLPLCYFTQHLANHSSTCDGTAWAATHPLLIELCLLCCTMMSDPMLFHSADAYHYNTLAQKIVVSQGKRKDTLKIWRTRLGYIYYTLESFSSSAFPLPLLAYSVMNWSLLLCLVTSIGLLPSSASNLSLCSC